MRIHVDIDDFLHKAADVAAQGEEIAARLAGQRVLDISYEALAADTADTVAAVCRFLDIDVAPARVQPALRKVGAADLRETVSNFQSLLDHPATRTLALSD